MSLIKKHTHTHKYKNRQKRTLGSDLYAVALRQDETLILKRQGTEKMFYQNLYQSIENTANQNAGKPLNICWYSTEPSYRAP